MENHLQKLEDTASLPEVASLMITEVKSVPKTCVIIGFKKAKILPSDDSNSDFNIEDCESLVSLDTCLIPELVELLHSDTEDENSEDVSSDSKTE